MGQCDEVESTLVMCIVHCAKHGNEHRDAVNRIENYLKTYRHTIFSSRLVVKHTFEGESMSGARDDRIITNVWRTNKNSDKLHIAVSIALSIHTRKFCTEVGIFLYSRLVMWLYNPLR